MWFVEYRELIKILTISDLKRKISYGTRSEAGKAAWKNQLTILDTCRKQGVSYYEYILDISDFLLGKQNNSNREWVAWYMGTESAAETTPAAVRWHQFKIHQTAYDSFQGPASDYGQIPAVYNIEMDPGEQHNIAGEHDFVIVAYQKIYRQLVASMRKYPNTPSWAYPIMGGAS